MKYLITFNTTIVRQEQASEWGIDKVLVFGSDITENLLNLPQDKQLLFFIPTVRDYSNSLSYSGVNLALRILMKYLSNDRTDINIVLMGNESEANFLLHYDYPNALKIPSMHYIRFNKMFVASYELPLRNKMRVEEYKPFLDNLGLKIPSSFKSTHSLTNEWCLFKWNSFMGLNENASSLEGYLYFDYLITLEKLNIIKNKKASDHLKNRISDIPASRILVIDDKDGWHRFFKEMFSKTDKVEVHCIGENFNKLAFEDIEKIIVDEVDNFKPDVIILDFRLMEDKDAEVKDEMKKISGYRVLANVLKGDYKEPLGSFGRQVIIFTATSRIENILLLRQGNADGFILKEKAENYHGKEITKKVISSMVTTLETAIDRAKFLIPLNVKLDMILEIAVNSDVKVAADITSQSVRQLTQNNALSEDILKLVFLDLFSILETEKSSEYKFINDYVQNNAPINILKYWNNIDSIRNSLAHGDKTVKIDCREENISASLIQEWTLKLCEFLIGFIGKHVISE
ncbi:MAG: response regulator [Barnesiella sp.]|nr:response regulator [Barnesiella sp.]